MNTLPRHFGVHQSTMWEMRERHVKKAVGKFPCRKQSCGVEQEPIILDSAYRHGVSDAAMLHALRFPVRHFVQADSMTMFIGLTRPAPSWKSV